MALASSNIVFLIFTVSFSSIFLKINPFVSKATFKGAFQANFIVWICTCPFLFSDSSLLLPLVLFVSAIILRVSSKYIEDFYVESFSSALLAIIAQGVCLVSLCYAMGNLPS